MARKQGRRKTSKDKKISLLVIAEGQTEINYIKGFFAKHSVLLKKYNIDYVGKKCNAIKVVEFIRAVEYKYEYIFAFVDRDPATNTAETYNNFCMISESIQHVCPAPSNPCYEVWLNLHDEYSTSPMDADKLYRIINKRFGNKYKSDEYIFEKLENKVENALSNAESLAKHWEEIGFDAAYSEMNPNTMVHHIIKKIIELDEKLQKDESS